MLFYHIDADVEIAKTEDQDKTIYYRNPNQDIELLCKRISFKADKMYDEKSMESFLFVDRADSYDENDTIKKIKLQMLVISESLEKVENSLYELKADIPYNLHNINISETTHTKFVNGIRRSRYTENHYEDIMINYNLPDVGVYNPALSYKEYLLTKNNKIVKEYESEARKYLCDSTLIPELKRIFSGKAHPEINVEGVPVQYLICIKNPELRQKVTKLLINALYDAGRLQNSRLYELIYKERTLFGPYDRDLVKETKALMKVCKGSLVRFDYLRGDTPDGSDTKYAGGELLDGLSKIIGDHRNEVQTIFCMQGEIPGTEKVFLEKLKDVPIVKIKEDSVNGTKAKEHLQILAEDDGLQADDELLKKVSEKGKTFEATELKQIYDYWHNKYIRTKIYPEYEKMATAQQELAKKEPEGNAYEILNKMTGLGEAKKVINRALDYYKAQKLFKEKGLKNDRPAMHLVFTGNPGTAKTTVARLFARILKENEILSEGKLLELGRSDLVGQYVGWTAPIVKRKFEEAKGSVLFIDEAYSLVDGHEGSYGDEAINTIVAEMENNREDTVVIFAGYPKEMEKFLDKNPGLRSRIAFHVPFEDYSAEELYEIAGLIAEDKGLSLESDVKSKLMPIFEKARTTKDFGNGRFVRNMIEKAKMNMAARLVHSDIENVTKYDCETLTAYDFEEPKDLKEETPKIGFAS